VLVGIWSGGAWLAERLQADLQPARGRPASSPARCTATTSARAAWPPGGRDHLPFSVDGAHILLIDDVLYTGRTIRAVVNELFDFGRPASVTLAVLVDRGGRELPIGAAFAAARIVLAGPPAAGIGARPGGLLFTFAVQRVTDWRMRRS
jgi:pyrimidine operon attenuation protein / uracil phosphoribosyltransferase